MFDDKKQNLGGQVPANLPTEEPEDILAGTEPIPATSSSPTSPQPRANSALESGSLRPVQPAMPTAQAPGIGQAPTPDPSVQMPSLADTAPPPQPSMIVPPSGAGIRDMEEETYKVKGPSLSKGLMSILFIAVFIGIVAIGGWLLYTKVISPVDAPDFLNQQKESGIQETTKQEEDQEPIDVESEPVEEDGTDIDKQIEDDEILFGEQPDADSDGLSDLRETDLGTNPNDWDTDDDGLNDYEEVVTWKTDPLNSDTDGDSYLDGSEVKAGYNPNGEGALEIIPEETDTEESEDASTSDEEL